MPKVPLLQVRSHTDYKFKGATHTMRDTVEFCTLNQFIMLAVSGILVTLLSLGSRAAAQLSPPSGVTIQVVQASCSRTRTPPSAELQDQSFILAVEYPTLTAYTDVTERFNDASCSVVVEFSYPAGYSFEVQNPSFAGNFSIASGGRAELGAYSSFDSSLPNVCCCSNTRCRFKVSLCLR
jgi:hypothetical protein